jgi:DNA-binding transcriptional LysR family regulator
LAVRWQPGAREIHADEQRADDTAGDGVRMTVPAPPPVTEPLPSSNALLRRLDLTTLQLFVAVAEEAILTKAAARAGIAPSAASKRLADLEQDLDVALFTRHSKGMQLTPAGDTLLVHARRMLLNVAMIGVELGEYKQGVRGHIRMLANLSAVVAFLPEDLQSFFAAHGDLRIELEERPTDRVVKGIVEGWAEIGICSRDADLMGLDAAVYRRDELVVVMRPDHPLARGKALAYGDTLGYEQIALHAESSIFTRSRIAAREAGRPLRRRIHVPGFDAICRTVQANLGIALIPAPVFEILGKPMNLHAERLTDGWARRELVVVTADVAALSTAGRLLRDHLLAGAPA